MAQVETQIWDNESQCYRRAVLHEALTHVRLSERITGDSPFGSDTIAEPGVYEAHLNPHGAVSIIAGNGKLLGLKPGEFEWVGTHAPTPAPPQSVQGWMDTELWNHVRGTAIDLNLLVVKGVTTRGEEILYSAMRQVIEIALRVSAPAPQYDWNTEPDPLLAELKYIADSPAQERGGFHPRVVAAAQKAIERIQSLAAPGEGKESHK